MNFDFLETKENTKIESFTVKEEIPIFTKFSNQGEINNYNEANKPIYLICRNESLENDIHPITGVPFERKSIRLENGEMVEGIFPKFESDFEVQLEPAMYLESDNKQFTEANKLLTESCKKDATLLNKFDKLQQEQILNGDQPDGFTWHHDSQLGKLVLVDSQIHGMTGHTGGRSIWGGGNESR